MSEIKSIISGGINDSDLVAALVRKRLAWQDAIASAQNKIDAIDRITECIKIERSNKLQELTDEQRAWLLVKMVCVEDLYGQKVLSEALWL